MLDRAKRLNSITNRLMLRGVLAFEDHRREISSSQQFASSIPEDSNNLNSNSHTYLKTMADRRSNKNSSPKSINDETESAGEGDDSL